MCYNKRCSLRKTCDKYIKSSCIYKMSKSMAIEIEKVRKDYDMKKEKIKKLNKKADIKITIGDLLGEDVLRKLKKIS
ncbi:hypothetical protein [Tepidibacter thalassicus]|nr:hypothetical protein [Tepidibacter thalassicus]